MKTVLLLFPRQEQRPDRAHWRPNVQARSRRWTVRTVAVSAVICAGDPWTCRSTVHARRLLS